MSYTCTCIQMEVMKKLFLFDKVWLKMHFKQKPNLAEFLSMHGHVDDHSVTTWGTYHHGHNSEDKRHTQESNPHTRSIISDSDPDLLSYTEFLL